MLTIAFILVGLLLAVAQTTVLMPAPVWIAAPDLYYALAAYAAYHFSFCRGFLIILPVSCIMDVYSGTVVGMYPAICGCGWLLLKFMAVKMPVRSSFYQIPLTGASHLFVCWLTVLLLDALHPEEGISWHWPPMLFRVGLLCLAAVPLFRFFHFIENRLRDRFLFLRAKRSVADGNQFRQDRGGRE